MSTSVERSERGNNPIVPTQLVEHAASFKLPSLVICFEPTPREFFAGDRAPVRLSTFRDKY